MIQEPSIVQQVHSYTDQKREEIMLWEHHTMKQKRRDCKTSSDAGDPLRAKYIAEHFLEDAYVLIL